MHQNTQSREILRQYLRAREVAPWIAAHAESRVRGDLQRMGGMAASWRTDYPICTYCYPVWAQPPGGGQMVLVDLSTPELVRAFYEQPAKTEHASV